MSNAGIDNRRFEHQETPSELNDQLVVERLKACQGYALEHAGRRFKDFYMSLEEQVLQAVDAAKTNQERTVLSEQSRTLKQARGEIEHYFLGFFGEGFIRFKRGELATHTGEERFQEDILSLVDNEDLEETIAISSITHRAENQYAESLWALNQRLAILNGGSKINDRGNPVGPIQYCEALRKSMARINLTTSIKILAYKTFEQTLVNQLAEPLSEVNDYLASQGILSNLKYRPSTNDGPPVAEVRESRVDEWNDVAGNPAELLARLAGQTSPEEGSGYLQSPDPTLPPAQYQWRLVDSIRTLQDRLGQLSTDTQAVAGGAVGDEPVPPANVVSAQQLVGALQSLQAQMGATALTQLQAASQGTVSTLSVADTRAQFIAQLGQQTGSDDAISSSDMHTIDLVGMLFEYMLSDDNLPDSVKALLSYLHTSFLKVAFLDKDFFDQAEHPARLLLNDLAEAGVKWVGNDGSSQYDIYEKIKNVVSRVLQEFDSDVRLFAELLLEFSSFTKNIGRRQELMEKRALEKVQGEEKLREVKMRVNEEVRSRTDSRELPSAALLLLLQPWSDYLTFTLLRYGEDSESWIRGLEAVDDLIWSIEPKADEDDKVRQLEMQEDLITVLEAGFKSIGYDQAKGKKLLDAVVSLQKMAIQSMAVEPASQPMRSKLEAIADEKAGKSTDDEDGPTPEELEMVEHLKMVEFGTWFEFEGGKRLKVAWYNAKTLHYMLVDQMGKKVAMMAGLELARDMLHKRAKVIAGSSKPFFERALENIFQNLNNQAEGIPQEHKS